MERVGIFVICAVLLASCTTLPPVTETDRTRTYEKSYEEVFKAAKRVLVDLDVEITHSEIDSGVLVGRKNVGMQTLSAVLTGVNKPFFYVYRITLFDAEGSTESALKIVVQRDDGSDANEVSKPGYDDFWSRMDALLL